MNCMSISWSFLATIRHPYLCLYPISPLSTASAHNFINYISFIFYTSHRLKYAGITTRGTSVQFTNKFFSYNYSIIMCLISNHCYLIVLLSLLLQKCDLNHFNYSGMRYWRIYYNAQYVWIFLKPILFNV